MSQYVIIEKLKDAIDNNKIKAAVFYTFNFDARFFENYILTTFLPHVNFSDNEIQNSILWRKYATDLPDVTVYCDFHAKNTEAPNLNYNVNTVDIPLSGGHKACFHPKVSFVLLDNDELIVLTGSNNLTQGGWCTNKEIVGIKKLQNGVFFPNKLKHELWNFLKTTNANNVGEFGKAEEKINSFFWKRLHTEESEFKFYTSSNSTFYNFLLSILIDNNESEFEQFEVISPYLSTGISLVQQLQNIVAAGALYMNVPYMATNEADITEDNYYNYRANGVKWSKLKEGETEKIFRFNHSKVYRFKTSGKAYTVVGSVNFTDAAWRGTKENGNVETAMIFEEEKKHWKPLLEEYENSDIVFPNQQSDETETEHRYDAPNFKFELNWQKKTLSYYNDEKFNFKGLILFNTRNIILKTGGNRIKLDENIINDLVNNPIIKIKQYHTQQELFYYPLQIGVESKPIPHKLRLKDGELIELWKKVSIKEEDKSEISNLIEKYIDLRLDKEGELVNDDLKTKSTLNMMASHISALIRLEERIFTVPNKKRENKKAVELLNYYLFVSNIDTLSGYVNLLDEMYNEKQILPAVSWFLLNLLLKDFYDKRKIKEFYKSIDSNSMVDEINVKTEGVVDEINIKMAKLKKELKNDKVSMELLKWIKSEL